MLQQDQNNWIFDVPTEHGVSSVEVHPGAHVDELLAILMLHLAATKQLVEKNANKTIGLGVGGGCFDEHPTNGQVRKEGECTATLVAKALGLTQDPVWSRLIRYAYWVDQGEPMPRPEGEDEKAYPEEWNHVFDINNLFKCRWRQLMKQKGSRVSNEDGLEYVQQCLADLTTFFTQQQDFMAAYDEIRQKGGNFEVENRGKSVRVVMITSDNPEINAAARHHEKADIVIRRSSRGNVQIFRNKQCRIGLDDLAQALIIRECELRKVDVPQWDDLRREGDGPCKVWYYFRPHGMLLNGSEQHERPATLIPENELIELVMLSLTSDYYYPLLADSCQTGSCRNSRETPCPLYRFGLGRCRKIRYDMQKNAV